MVVEIKYLWPPVSGQLPTKAMLISDTAYKWCSQIGMRGQRGS